MSELARRIRSWTALPFVPSANGQREPGCYVGHDERDVLELALEDFGDTSISLDDFQEALRIMGFHIVARRRHGGSKDHPEYVSLLPIGNAGMRSAL